MVTVTDAVAVALPMWPSVTVSVGERTGRAYA